MTWVGSGGELDGTPIGEVDQHLVALARSNQQASHLDRLGGLPEGGPAYSAQFLLSMAIMAIMAIIILAVSVWAVRRVTAPLAELATAANRLGHSVSAPPLPEVGTVEIRQAARAFNEMQTRLRSHRQPNTHAGGHIA